MLLPRVLTVALLVFTFVLTSAGGQPQTRFKDPPSSGDIPADSLPVGRWSVEFANGVVEACEIRKPVFGIAERAVRLSEVDALRKNIEQQVAKVYPLKHAVAEQMVVLLRSLFIVVNPQEAYARFHLDETTNSLIVGASGHHQRQIARVLALVDTPNNVPVQGVERDAPEQLVKGYQVKHADGEAAVAVLRSLFLVVNHRIAYARFGYDARTRLLIAVASEKHQKQIAVVLDLLETQTIPATEGSRDGNVEQPVRVYPIKHIDGEQLLAKLRSQFVVVNHQQAEARFGFDQRTHVLIVIATRKLHTRIRELIVGFDRSPERSDKECFSTRQDSIPNAASWTKARHGLDVLFIQDAVDPSAEIAE
jgi:hypothetical protein